MQSKGLLGEMINPCDRLIDGSLKSWQQHFGIAI